LIRQADRKLNLTRRVAQALWDSRRQKSCDHRQVHMLRQRVYGLALGYEDLNDHEALRDDPAFQTFVERDRRLAHPSTLCRFENRADREAAVLLSKPLVDQFIESHKKPHEEVILDFDYEREVAGCADHIPW
jgi:hypothetical protein